MALLGKLAELLHASPDIVTGWAISLIGFVMLIARTKTEWSLDEKSSGASEGGIQAKLLLFLAMWAGCLAMGFTQDAKADQMKTFSAVMPTQYEDGTALALADLARWNVACGHTAGGPYTAYTSVNRLPTVTSFPDVFAPGTWFCSATATTTASKGALTSDFSMPEVSFIVPQPKPKAPTGFSVN